MPLSYRSTAAALAVGLLLLTAGCASIAGSESSRAAGQVVPVGEAGSYTNINPEQLQGLLAGEDFMFVNVHVPNEGQIPGTDEQIPYDQIRSRLERFPEDRAASVVLYCRSGSMSSVAARVLVEQGYTNVYNLDGGFRAWEAQGLPFSR